MGDDECVLSVMRQTNIPGLVGASFINPSSLGNNSKAAFLRACAALNERFVKMVSTNHPLQAHPQIALWRHTGDTGLLSSWHEQIATLIHTSPDGVENVPMLSAVCSGPRMGSVCTCHPRSPPPRTRQGCSTLPSRRSVQRPSNLCSNYLERQYGLLEAGGLLEADDVWPLCSQMRSMGDVRHVSIK